jgi:DNA-binding winged helix-turn-helix (wHTH) protein
LLRYLVANSGRALSREELLANVWRISPHGLPTRTIDMHVARLREKLRDNSDDPQVLVTVRGKGYMFHPCDDPSHEGVNTEYGIQNSECRSDVRIRPADGHSF